MKRYYCIALCNLILLSAHAQLKSVEAGHYLFPEFTQGVVLFKSGKRDAKPLNYNSLTEELVFDNKGTTLAVPKEQLQHIDTVFIRERKFIISNDKFVELLRHSAWDLYVEHKCELKEQGKTVGYGGTSELSAVSNPSTVRLGGIIYNLELPNDFETRPYSHYWLKKNGELKQITNMRQLKKLYKEKGGLFDDYVKTHDVEYEDQESILQLIEHLEAN